MKTTADEKQTMASAPTPYQPYQTVADMASALVTGCKGRATTYATRAVTDRRADTAAGRGEDQ